MHSFNAFEFSSAYGGESQNEMRGIKFITSPLRRRYERRSSSSDKTVANILKPYQRTNSWLSLTHISSPTPNINIKPPVRGLSSADALEPPAQEVPVGLHPIVHPPPRDRD